MGLSTFRAARLETPQELDRRPSLGATTLTSQSTASKASVRSSSAHNASPNLYSEEPDLTELNNALSVLVILFPDVLPEVFREMLCTFSADSRLHVVAEQLLKQRAKWVNGRWRIPSRDNGSRIVREVFELEKISLNSGHETDTVLRLEETFRTKSYKRAVKAALYQEFKALSKSTVDGVLAEQNHSYTLSRVILLGLAAKSWRSSVKMFFSKWKKPSQETVTSHYMLVWTRSPEGGPTPLPSLRETGDAELELELRRTILEPLLDKRYQAQEEINTELATLLNEQEAERADALYECECCFSDTTFEQMATCTTGDHIICFTCIQRTLSEALHGQSWSLSINHTSGQIACLVPTSSTPCSGCIPYALARRAILAGKGGIITWDKFQARLASEALFNSQLPFVCCPFCPYAEIDDLHLPHLIQRWRLNTSYPFYTTLLLLLSLTFVPVILFNSLLCHFVTLPRLSTFLDISLARLTRRTYFPTRFVCRSPTCLRASCLKCRKPWRDPHICHESATLSLRTTIEAARTAAVKRTCPRCGLGFVKESGCNKMVCVCGYSMCYICRQGLGQKIPYRNPNLNPNPAQVQPRNFPRAVEAPNIIQQAFNAVAEDFGGEGYNHFCQHFRPVGGRCTDCEKCDLYKSENEDEIARRAGERAEKEWRIGEGKGLTGVYVDVRGNRGGKFGAKGLKGLLDAQAWMDWWVESMFKC